MTENIERIPEDIRELIKKDAGSQVREQALAFPNEATYLAALKEVINLRAITKRNIKYRPLGGFEDRMVITSDDDFPELSKIFQKKGINFTSSRVRSMGELTREERIELRRTGRRIG